MKDNVFDGPRAAIDRLNLNNLPLTPLIEIDPSLNPLKNDGVQIFAKIMAELPWSHIKVIAAYHMLDKASREGKLEGVHTLVEATSGNTGSALAVIARAYSISKVVVVVPRDIAPGKLNRLIVEGAQPEFYDKGETGVEKARQLGKQAGWFNLGQYSNEDNSEAHGLVTMKQTYQQLGPSLSLVSAGIGTAGTALGCQEYLDARSPRAEVIGVILEPGQDAVPGIRTRDRLKEISLPWQRLRHLQEISVKEAYSTSLQLLRTGIEAGPSSGAALIGGIKYLLGLKEKEEREAIERFRNNYGKIVMVVICPDNHLPYLDKYSTHLGPGEGF